MKVSIFINGTWATIYIESSDNIQSVLRFNSEKFFDVMIPMGVARSRKSKDKPTQWPKEKLQRTNNNDLQSIIQHTYDRATWTPLKPGDELGLQMINWIYGVIL